MAAGEWIAIVGLAAPMLGGIALLLVRVGRILEKLESMDERVSVLERHRGLRIVQS